MPRPAPDPALVAAVVNAYKSSTSTLEEIAAAAGISKSTVLRWLRTENVPTRAIPTTRTTGQDTNA